MELRPMARMSLSLKRMAWPMRVASISSQLASVSSTPMSSSSSRSTMAMRPVLRRFENSSSAVFLIVPQRVAMTR